MSIYSPNDQQIFNDCAHFYGFYWDNTIVVFKGKWLNNEVTLWFKTFQTNTDNLLNSKNLELIAVEIQMHKNTDKSDITMKKRVTIINKSKC
jgi:hypothetical protein